MLLKSRAIVLHTLRYNDTNIICHLLTEQAGCAAFIVGISSSRKARVRHTLFQPLQRMEIEWNAREREGLERIRNVSALPFASIPCEPRKAAVALFLAEFMWQALKKEPPSPGIFHYVWQSLQWYDLCTAGYANFHLVFLLRFSRLLGIFPNTDNYADGTWFDLLSGDFVASRPTHGHVLSPDDTALLPKLLRMQYQSMHVFRFNGSQRSRLLQFVCDYYRLHVAEFPELKSLPVLREVFL